MVVKILFCVDCVTSSSGKFEFFKVRAILRSEPVKKF